MKKFLFALLVILSASFFMQAEAQQLRYYYYPSNNVYYDIAKRQYIYSDNGTWRTVAVLPSGMVVKGKTRYVVNSTTPQVWEHNADHVKKYKVTPAPKGKAVGYKGTNPNKAGGTSNKPVIKAKTKGKSKG